jgi:hypothetical protein
LTDRRPERYADTVKRLEVAGVRVCQRCGRGRAELKSEDGSKLTIALDAGRVRDLQPDGGESVQSLTDLILEQFAGVAREVVLDIVDGHLSALLSLTRDGVSDVVACTPQEGLALAVRGGLKLYATDEALARRKTEPVKAEQGGGPSGSGTLH